jgi:hypothetical protein
VRSFATWHHLRRLRGEWARHHITAEQSDYVHNEVRAAITLITWLWNRGTSLAACTQRDIDDWLAGGPATCFHALAFVTWASSHSHARDVEISRPARKETLAQIEEDRRRELVRSLLHDDAYAIEDRVAGLLVLLHGQPLAASPASHATRSPTSRQASRCCSAPCRSICPGPLDGLLRQLLGRRHERAAVGRTSDHPTVPAQDMIRAMIAGERDPQIPERSFGTHKAPGGAARLSRKIQSRDALNLKWPLGSSQRPGPQGQTEREFVLAGSSFDCDHDMMAPIKRTYLTAWLDFLRPQRRFTRFMKGAALMPRKAATTDPAPKPKIFEPWLAAP